MAIDKIASMRCYLEALYNDPDPNSVAWDWINGKNDKEINIMTASDPKSLETVKNLRKKYMPITDS